MAYTSPDIRSATITPRTTRSGGGGPHDSSHVAMEYFPIRSPNIGEVFIYTIYKVGALVGGTSTKMAGYSWGASKIIRSPYLFRPIFFHPAIMKQWPGFVDRIAVGRTYVKSRCAGHRIRASRTASRTRSLDNTNPSLRKIEHSTPSCPSIRYLFFLQMNRADPSPVRRIIFPVAGPTTWGDPTVFRE